MIVDNKITKCCGVTYYEGKEIECMCCLPCYWLSKCWPSCWFTLFPLH